jgi:hypothetical protein
VQAQPRGDGLDREQFAAVSLGQPSVALLKRGLTLTHRDHEELHVYLIEECWRLSLKYDAERGEFTTWIGRARGRSITDWQRKHYGRTKWVFRDRVYERPRPQLVSLDAGDPDGDRLVDSLPARAGDPATDSDPDLEELLADGDRQRARDLDTLGLEAPRRAAR